MTSKIITDVTRLNAEIDKLAKSKIDQTIQRLLVSSFYHRMLSGDNTLITRVLNAMPRGSRVSAAQKYVEAFFFVELVKEKGVYAATNTHKFRDTVDEEALEAAQAVNWWEFKPAKEVEEYSREAVCDKLRKALDKAIKAASEAGDSEFADVLASVDLPL